MAKDLFSDQSKIYAQFRPTYPQELFDYILQFVDERKCAWDCATGNGQAANVLADYFEKVEASDISEAQINNAIRKKNINYHICRAEQTPFTDNSFDLITVAQAYHWLNWKKFHDEATRVGKRNSVIAIWCYSLLSTNDEKLNEIILHLYHDITGPYWDYERRFVDNGYSTADFDFAPLPPRTFEINLQWSKEQLTGYFETWSSVLKYKKTNAINPVEFIKNDIDDAWSDDQLKNIRFPVFLRIGRIIK
jgi:hypothetical protein